MHYPWKNWPEFQCVAVDSILQGFSEGSLQGRRLLQISFLPAFGNPESWELLGEQGGNAAVHMVMRNTWRFDVDYPDIDAPGYGGPDSDSSEFEDYVARSLPNKPTIDHAIAAGSFPKLDEFLQQIHSISISAIATDDMPSEDVECYEVRLCNVSCESRFRWYATGPSAWTVLVGPTLDTLAYLQEVISHQLLQRTPLN